MFKIKEYILNENKVKEIIEESGDLVINFDGDNSPYQRVVMGATFKDIEWNYGNNSIEPYVNISRNLAEDLVEAKRDIRELEEKNEELKIEIMDYKLELKNVKDAKKKLNRDFTNEQIKLQIIQKELSTTQEEKEYFKNSAIHILDRMDKALDNVYSYGVEFNTEKLLQFQKEEIELLRYDGYMYGEHIKG